MMMMVVMVTMIKNCDNFDEGGGGDIFLIQTINII